VIKLGYALLKRVCAITTQDDESSSNALDMDH
jgi:hypothetical protein